MLSSVWCAKHPSQPVSFLSGAQCLSGVSEEEGWRFPSPVGSVLGFSSRTLKLPPTAVFPTNPPLINVTPQF